MSSLGLEGLITFKRDTHSFDPEDYSITIPGAGGKDVKFSVFDAITVEVSIEKDPNTQRGKVKMVMVKPMSSEGL
jgi:exosome complex exonuclease DIS3/RRP44